MTRRREATHVRADLAQQSFRRATSYTGNGHQARQIGVKWPEPLLYFRAHHVDQRVEFIDVSQLGNQHEPLVGLKAAHESLFQG